MAVFLRPAKNLRFRPITTTTTIPRFHQIAPSLRLSSTMPVFAEGTDEKTAMAGLNPLLASGWTLDEEERGLNKTYYFKTYTKSVDFLNVVAIRSKSKNHHATMTLKFGSVDIHWTTHFPRGLSMKDVDMAQYCDEQSAHIGTVDQSQAQKCHA
ncbi:hypothetical protein AJ80_06871 [Polytolypa hystricis UAMH7299]|uniref:4a-hydroxytetrahydrobiopterin dehydratase n=1 Tax=Polytolypa hystricis (strain UAMH7299) TaxID=1447883 RepID=A0A2B7XTT6_POLH7|nr:hypothetical protein AJ80_06871 [Polytolypa hystricis UAMH7299]